jgi:pyruvate dehydrogenase E1 component alpha subunit
MPCHYTWKQGNYHAMSSVIGTQISHAVGAAMAAKIRGDENVAIAGYLGDGATSANDFHAGMNFAQVYKAPVVLICQNNQWAISVPIHKQSARARRSRRRPMPTACRACASTATTRSPSTRPYAEAVDRAAAGEGPTLVELVTYRRLGHSSSDDPTKYRDESEVVEWEKRDPVDRYAPATSSVSRVCGTTRRSRSSRTASAARSTTAIKRGRGRSACRADRSLIEDVFADVPDTCEQLDDALWPRAGVRS